MIRKKKKSVVWGRFYQVALRYGIDVVSMYAGGFFAGFSGYLGKMGRMGSDGIGLCCVVVCFCTLA